MQSNTGYYNTKNVKIVSNNYIVFLVVWDYDTNDALEIAFQEDYGQPGWEWKYWLVITDVKIFKQNGRETTNSVAISDLENLGCKSETRM
jgi:hypothetical protein